MKSFIEFIDENEFMKNKHWITANNGRKVLLGKDGEIFSGELQGTNFKNYKDNMNDLHDEDEDEKSELQLR